MGAGRQGGGAANIIGGAGGRHGGGEAGINMMVAGGGGGSAKAHLLHFSFFSITLMSSKYHDYKKKEIFCINSPNLEASKGFNNLKLKMFYQN